MAEHFFIFSTYNLMCYYLKEKCPVEFLYERMLC